MEDTEEETKERRLGKVEKRGIEDRLLQVRSKEGRFCCAVVLSAAGEMSRLRTFAKGTYSLIHMEKAQLSFSFTSSRGMVRFGGFRNLYINPRKQVSTSSGTRN